MEKMTGKAWTIGVVASVISLVVVSMALSTLLNVWPRLQSTSSEQDSNNLPHVAESVSRHANSSDQAVFEETRSKSKDEPKAELKPAASQPRATLGGAAMLSGSPIAREYAALDAERDGWSSESIHELIKGQMKKLAKQLESVGQLKLNSLSQIVSPKFSATHLRPQQLETVFESQAFRVQRPASDGAPTSGVFRGIEGAVAAFQELAAPVKESDRRRLDVKIFRVTLSATHDEADSEAAIVFSGLGAGQSVQQNATWRCRWSLSNPALPRLVSVEASDYEQVTRSGQDAAMFVDMAPSVFGKNDCWLEQLRPGMDYWTARVEQGLGMYLDGWTGIAVGDVNGDQLDDIYVCQPGGLPNRLFLHQSDGTATEVAAQMSVDWLDRSTGALIVDLDNDGAQDLAVAIQGGVLVLQNRGDEFRLRQAIPTDGQPYSLAAADYDQDGRLDIFVCCYNRGSRAAQQGSLDVPVPYYDANNGAGNLMVRNEGGFVFSDVTNEVGLAANNQRFSYAAAWEDFDNDGDQDLYVANDFGRNNLYQNTAGRFTDVAGRAGVEDVGSGMSVAWSDYNGDGWMDLYVGNMFSAAGSRITYQRRFAAAFNSSALSTVRRLARGNTMFRNAGDGTMQDVSAEAGVALGRWAWSSNFVDINNDGLEDLIVANGFVTGGTDVDL